MSRLRWCCLLSILLLAGCATTPPAAFYTLSTASQPAANPSPLTIGLTLNEFPAALDRPQIMVRDSDNRLSIEELHRWAGPLDQQVLRTLLENLALRTGGQRLEAAPWPADFHPDRRVEISILRFDGHPGERAGLTARWRLNDASGAPLYIHISNFDEPAGDTIETLVAAQSRLLARLAKDIAAALLAPGTQR